MAGADFNSPNVSTDDSAWQEVQATLDALAALAREDVPREQFRRQLLEQVARLTSADGVVIWVRAENGAIEPAERIGQAAREIEGQLQLAGRVFEANQGLSAPAGYRSGAFQNPSSSTAMLEPIRLDERTEAVVELLLAAHLRGDVQDGLRRLLRTACDIAEDYYQQQAIRDFRSERAAQQSRVALLQQLQGLKDVREAAFLLANEGRRLVEADRVIVLANRFGRMQVEGVSGVEAFDRRSGVLQAWQELAQRLLAVDETLWHPSDAELPPPLESALNDLIDENHARTLVAVPLHANIAGAVQVVGLIGCERFDETAPNDWRRRVEELVADSGGAFGGALVSSMSPLGGIGRRYVEQRWQWGAKRWLYPLMILVAGMLIALPLTLIKVDFTIEARGELLPVERFNLFAPSDGVVVELTARDGATVAEGAPLVKLENPSLAIELNTVLGKQRTVEEDWHSAETEWLRLEEDPDANSKRGPAGARIQQLKQQLLDLQKEQAILERQRADLQVCSPIKGAVLTWDIARRLGGRPVKRGDLLLTVADLDQPWQLQLDVPDQQASYIVAAADEAHETLPVAFRLGNDTGRAYHGKLESISPVTQLNERNEPVVRLTVGTLAPKIDHLRPGAETIAQVSCGRRSIGYVWLKPLWETVRRHLW